MNQTLIRIKTFQGLEAKDILTLCFDIRDFGVHQNMFSKVIEKFGRVCDVFKAIKHFFHYLFLNLA